VPLFFKIHCVQITRNKEAPPAGGSAEAEAAAGRFLSWKRFPCFPKEEEEQKKKEEEIKSKEEKKRRKGKK